MIKTVSFAPPRSARAAAKVASQSPRKAVKAQPARAEEAATVAAKPLAKPAKTQSARVTSGSSPVAKTKAEATTSRLDSGAQTPATVARAKKRALKTDATPDEVTPAKRAARKAKPTTSTQTPQNASPVIVATAPAVAPKAKRSRAPRDLAAQYGAAPETEMAPRIAEKNAPRKRLTRAEKEARTQLLTPDEELMQRLQQANAVEVKQPARRGRGWEFECGRCGRISRFQTAGAICECGAIAVRE